MTPRSVRPPENVAPKKDVCSPENLASWKDVCSPENGLFVFERG